LTGHAANGDISRMRTRHGWIRTGTGTVAAAALAVGLGALAPAAARADDGPGCNTQVWQPGLDPGLSITTASCARQDADGSYVVTMSVTYDSPRPHVTSCELMVEGWSESRSGADAAPLSRSVTDCTLAVRYGDTQRIETRYSTLPAGWYHFFALGSFTAYYSDRDGDEAGGWSPIVTATS
jgi:hypothetical protein